MKIFGSDQLAIVEAAALLEQGKLVAFPTETVYGLGADAENPLAVAAIYAAKGRPANHPVIVHLAAHADLERWAQQGILLLNASLTVIKDEAHSHKH